MGRNDHERVFASRIRRVLRIGGAALDDGAPREGTWTKSCNALAEQAGLSVRERDVLFLLGKGRTIEFIANDLGISFNTAKSHIRNVYTKVGVHSKQELQSLIDERRDAS